MFKLIDITDNKGAIKTIKIGRFKAMDGWELQSRFVSFAASTDKDFRRAFTMEILAYASIIDSAGEIPLITDAVVDNHLQRWENVREVFEAILTENGIDPATHANNPSYWAEAGNQMAMAFLAACSELVEPAMRFAAENVAASEKPTEGGVN